MPAGSPPRVWGKPAAGDEHVERTRFTPTRVGKTCKRWSFRQKCPVHPHACGENASVLADFFGYYGSPPRVWGKLHKPPALQLLGAVHPHACGENMKIGNTVSLPFGSPPRVWGKLSADTR